jgi:hypothetical protein
VDFQDNPSRTDPARLLVAADASVDAHRLVGLCCERAGDPLRVSLVVPLEDGSGTWSERSARTVGFLGHAATLLDAAGVRLEDVFVADDGREVDDLVRSSDFDALLVCAPRQGVSSPALSLAVRSARAHGLAVLGNADQTAGPASWLRRVFPRWCTGRGPGSPVNRRRHQAGRSGGLVLALRLLHTPAGSARALPALREGAGP